MGMAAGLYVATFIFAYAKMQGGKADARELRTE